PAAVSSSLPSAYAWSLAAIVAAAVLAVIASTLNKTLTVSLPIALWALALAAVGAVPLLGRLDGVVSGWLALAALALVALLFLRPRAAVGARYRIILAVLAAASGTLALALS